MSSGNPSTIYLGLMLGQAICFSLFFTVQLVFHVTVVGLNPFQMVLVGVVLEVTWVLGEIPTGVIADVVSRRRSVIAGIALMGCSYTLEGGVATFWAALLSQVLWGIGGTCTSGATQAWIADEIGMDRAGPLFLRGRQVWLAGILIGTISATLLALVNIQIPMVAAGLGMFALTLVLLRTMPENGMPESPHRSASTGIQLCQTALDGFAVARKNRLVRMLLIISFITGLAAEAYDRLHVPSLLGRFDFPVILGRDDPVITFGISSVIAALTGIGAAHVFRRLNPGVLQSGSPATLLSICAAAQALLLIGFTLSPWLWGAFATIWLRTAVAAISGPVEMAWLNRNLTSATRATVGSMSSQANSLGQVGGGLALGWISGAYSIRAALLASALILTPTIGLYRRLHDRPAPQNKTGGVD